MPSSINPLRRQLALALTLAPYWLAARSWASPASQGEGRMLVVLLRGGLDGLFALSPSADPRWTSARPTLSQLALTQGLPLPGSGFVAHPALPELAALYQAGELLFCPTAGTPDVSRSHFQSQDVFELGNGIEIVGVWGGESDYECDLAECDDSGGEDDEFEADEAAV